VAPFLCVVIILKNSIIPINFKELEQLSDLNVKAGHQRLVFDGVVIDWQQADTLLPQPHHLLISQCRILDSEKIGHCIVDSIVLHEITENNIIRMTHGQDYPGIGKQSRYQWNVANIKRKFVYQDRVGIPSDIAIDRFEVQFT